MSLKEQSIDGAKRVAHMYTPAAWKAHNWLWRIALLLGTLLALILVLMFWWSREPSEFSVEEAATAYIPAGAKPVVGSYLVGTSIKTLDIMLNKPGGFLKNDVMPPGVLMDNIPQWEAGVLTLMRQTSLMLKDEFSRSQSQSTQPEMLAQANGALNIDFDKWMFPSAEDEYEKARQKLIQYAVELSDGNPNNAQFFARADNLANYFGLISRNLGDIAQRLSASVGDAVVAQSAAGEANAKPNTVAVRQERTPRLKVDNNFYFARGYTWALLHQLRAIRHDFAVTLEQKTALASLDQIIAELEKAQKPVWSPIILNGRGFGFTANHSLVMASYISRVNAALIDIQALLRAG